MKLTQKLLAVVLATAMCTGLAACHTGQDTKWIAKIGEDTVPAGVYMYMLHEQYYNVTSGLTDKDGKPIKNPLNEKIEDVTASQKIAAETRKDMNEYLAIEEKAKEFNITVPEEDKIQIDAMMESYWSYVGKSYTDNGISKDSYRLAMMNSSKKSAIFDHIYGENGTDPVPESEMKDKYNKDFAKVIMISQELSTEEDATVKAEADKKVRNTMDQYYKEIVDGTNMDDVYYQAQRESATDPSTVTKPEPGKSFTFVIKDSSSLDKKVIDAIFAAALDKPVKIETDTSVYLFVKYDINANPEDFTSRKATLSRMLREDTFNKQVEEWGNSLSAQWNDKALQRYTPEKLKIN